MIRRHSFCALISVVLLALAASPAAFGQAKKQKPARRERPASTAKAARSSGTTGSGFGVAESLSGTIQMVVADQNLLVVNGPNNVPYDLEVTPKTLVVVNERRGTIQSLANQIGRAVTVAFVAQRNGDMATRVEVTD
jgi:hypothetical protein